MATLVRPPHRPVRVGLPLLAAVMLAGHALALPRAQATVITGTISTLDGKVPLTGAAVTVTTTNGAAVGEALTDALGRYRIEVTRGGTYRLNVTIEGFRPANLEVVLAAGATRIADLDLRLLAIEQVVDVRPADNTPLSLGTPLSPAQRIDGRTIAGSAMSSGSVAAELRWQPGVTPYGREWAINGGRPTQIGLLVDGAHVLDPAAGTSPVQLPGDAVNSIQVLANPYDVEFGRFSSGLIAVSTRPGREKWTGTVNSFLPVFILRRGSHPLDIIGVERVNPRVTVAGPLRKDRLFLTESAQFRYSSGEVASRPQDQRHITRSFISFTRLDWVLTEHHTVTGSFTLAPEEAHSVTLSTFTPLETSADLSQRVYRGGISETAQLPHGMVLESRVHVTRYRSEVDGHGDATEMFLAPEGNSGTYYGKQDRISDAWQVSSTLAGFLDGRWGQHLVKGGVDVLRAAYRGTQQNRPVSILREDGTLTRRLTTAPSRMAFEATDAAAFLQDRWSPLSRLAVDLGLRVERDGVAGRINMTPRLGAAVTLDAAGRVVVRGGWGHFYERTPTMTGAFGQLPDLFEAAYAADGRTPLGPPVRYAHALDRELRTPRSVTWNLAYEHELPFGLAVRANHLERRGSHELIIGVGQAQTAGWMELESSGRSSYRDTEVGVHFERGARINLDVSYTHSSSWADHNDAYGYHLDLLANPVVRQNQSGPTNTDTPDRLVMLVRALASRNWAFEIAGEIRTGFPYSAVDEQLEFVGPPNRLRFPTNRLVDVSIERRVRAGKLVAWVGVWVTNVFNTFTPADVQSNIASPAFGGFYSSPVRKIAITVQFHP